MTGRVENIIIIVADALRADKVDSYSGGDLTPNIDSIASEGEVFEQCYACINATDPSITTILTGLYPTRHGILNHGSRVTEKEYNHVSGTEPLPSLLTETHQSVGIDTLERWHQRGFNEYLNPRDSGGYNISQKINIPNSLRKIGKLSTIKDKAKSILRSTNTNRPIRSKTITNLAEDFLQESDEPFFLFTHYWDSHIPYIPLDDCPKKIRDRTYDGEDIKLDNLLDSIKESPWKKELATQLTGNATTLADMRRKYDAGIWKVDQAIGGLINSLKQQGVFEETAVIITSDHGESLTEHQIFFDHHGLYDQSVHVPLIIKAPGFSGRETQFVQHFDLAPTVMNLLNMNYDSGAFDGVTLTYSGNERSLQRDAVYMEESHTARKRAIRTKSRKYIRRLDNRDLCRYCRIKHGAEEELYELESDPGEECNVINQDPDIAEQLKQKLSSWIQDLPKSKSGKGSFEPSNDVKDHLEEMGYL